MCILRSGVKSKTADNLYTSGLNGFDKSPRLKDEHHLSSNRQVTIDTAMSDFNSGQMKNQTKKMATQVNFYLYLNALLSSELFDA